jgi:hypothetical protein
MDEIKFGEETGNRGFQVFTPVNVDIAFFWLVTQSSVIVRY